MPIAYEVLNLDGTGVTVSEMAHYLELAERTIRDRIKKTGGEFTLENGTIKAAQD